MRWSIVTHTKFPKKPLQIVKIHAFSLICNEIDKNLMENNGVSRFRKVYWETWVSISSPRPPKLRDFCANLITAAESNELRGGDLGDKCLQSVRRLATARSGETRDDDRIASVHGLSENYQKLRNFIESSQKKFNFIKIIKFFRNSMCKT